MRRKYEKKEKTVSFVIYSKKTIAGFGAFIKVFKREISKPPAQTVLVLMVINLLSPWLSVYLSIC